MDSYLRRTTVLVGLGALVVSMTLMYRGRRQWSASTMESTSSAGETLAVAAAPLEADIAELPRMPVPASGSGKRAPPTERALRSQDASSVSFSGTVTDAEGRAVTPGQIGVLGLFPRPDPERTPNTQVLSDLSAHGRFQVDVPSSFLDGAYALVVVVDEYRELYRSMTRIAEGVTLHVGARQAPAPGRFRLLSSPVIERDPAALIELLRADDDHQVWSAFVEDPVAGGDTKFFLFRPGSDTGGPFVAQASILSREHGRIPIANLEFETVGLFRDALAAELVMRARSNPVFVPPFDGAALATVDVYDARRRLRFSRSAAAGSFRGLLPGTYVVRGMRASHPVVAGTLHVSGEEPAAVEWWAALPGPRQIRITVRRGGAAVADCAVTFTVRSDSGEVIYVADADGKTDQEGRTTLSGSPRGSLRVAVYAPGQNVPPHMFDVASTGEHIDLNLLGDTRIEVEAHFPSALWDQRPPLISFCRQPDTPEWREIDMIPSTQCVRVDSAGAHQIAVMCGDYWAGAAEVSVVMGQIVRAPVVMREVEPITVSTPEAPGGSRVRFVARGSPGSSWTMPWESAPAHSSTPARLHRAVGEPGVVRLFDPLGRVLAETTLGTELSGSPIVLTDD